MELLVYGLYIYDIYLWHYMRDINTVICRVEVHALYDYTFPVMSYLVSDYMRHLLS